jgi:beta-xylosidase
MPYSGDETGHACPHTPETHNMHCSCRLCRFGLFALVFALLVSPLCLAGAGDLHVTPATVAAPHAEPAEPVVHVGFESLDRWGKSGQPGDAAMAYQRVTTSSLVREGDAAVRLTFDAARGPQGMKYYQLPDVSGSDGLEMWVHGDGSGVILQLRLSQEDWSAWDCPALTVDFTGWRRFVVRKEDCRFRNWGKQGRDWDSLRVFAPRLSGASGSVVIDDLTFYAGSDALMVEPIPSPEPITLHVDAAAEQPAIPPQMKGVDFALINWGANQKHLNFGPETRALFRQSGAKLVRFWTFCPMLEVSPKAGEYNWERFDAQMQRIADAGAQTIMTCCFTPKWLSESGTRWGLPNDWDAYEKLIRDTVAHCREKGFDVAYWEAWNEPNLKTPHAFLEGTREDYLELYSHFVRAVRAVDPQAKVGGPALASPDMEWIEAQLAYAQKHDLPLDFLSWHAYDLPPEGFAASIDAVRAVAAQYPPFQKVDLLIDEWNASGGPSNAYDTEFAAAFLVATIDRMLAKNLTGQAFFAFKESADPLSDDGRDWGLITRNDIPKASYHAFRMLAELQGPRLAITGSDGEVGALASKAGDGVDVILYRFTTADDAQTRDVSLALKNWSGAENLEVAVELVDATHSNPYFEIADRQIEIVMLVAPIAAEALDAVTLPMGPQTVARVKIRPTEAAVPEGFTPQQWREQLVTHGPAVFPSAEMVLQDAASASGRWQTSEPVELEPDGGLTVPPSLVRERLLFFQQRYDGGAARTYIKPLASGIDARCEVAVPENWRPGVPLPVTVVLRNAQPLDADVELSLAVPQPAKATPAEKTLTLSAGELDREVRFNVAALPADLLRSAIWPRVTVRSLRHEGRPLRVASPRPTARPQQDEYTTFLSPLDSLDAVTQPPVGSGGEINEPTWVEGGVILPKREMRFPGEALPADVGTLELWIEPTWNAPQAPDRGTLMYRPPLSETDRSSWDLKFINDDGKVHLVWELTEATNDVHRLEHSIGDWQAGQKHHVMISWNRFTGQLAMAIDGKNVAEKNVARAMKLSAGGKFDLNRTGPRKPTECIFRGVRISNVQRVAAEGLETPAVPVEVRGLLIEQDGAK